MNLTVLEWLRAWGTLKLKAQVVTALLFLCLTGVFLGCTGTSSTGSRVTVIFPTISGPEQITGGDKEHFFASYYGINSWSASQRYVTVLQTDIKYKLPDEMTRLPWEWWT